MATIEPDMRVEVRPSDPPGGPDEAYVDGRRWMVRDGYTARQEVIEFAAGLARRRRVRSLLVLSVVADGSSALVNVFPDGKVTEYDPDAPLGEPTGGAAVAASGAAVSAGRARPASPRPERPSDRATPAPTGPNSVTASPRRGGSYARGVPAPGGGETARSTPEGSSGPAGDDLVLITGNQRRGVSRRSALIGAVSLMLAGGATTAVVATRGGSTPAAGPTGPTTGKPTPSTSSPRNPLPGQAPAGWAQQATWSMQGLVDPVSPAVATLADRVFVAAADPTTGSPALVAVNAATGARVWARPLTDGPVTQGPVVTPVNGKPSVMVVTASTVIVFDPAGKTPPARYKLPKFAVALFGTYGALFPVAGTNTVLLIEGSKLATKTIPAKTSPQGLMPGGKWVLASDNKGRVWVCTDAKSAPKKPTHVLPGPATGTPGKTIGFAPGVLLNAFVSKTTPTTSVPCVYRLDKNFTPLWWVAPVTTPVGPDTYRLAPNGSWATVGNTWVSIRTGESRVISPTWQSYAVSQEYAWSESFPSNIATATNLGVLATASVPDSRAVLRPVASTKGLALMVATQGKSSALFAVPRATTGAAT